MAYNFQYLFDEWAPNGVKTAPSIALKSTGFVGEMRAPAPVFNYQWDKIGRAITELQKVAITEDPSGGVWENLSAVATSGSWNDLLDKPNFHAISTSGSYNDLEDAPTTWAADKITGMTEWLTANSYRKIATGTYTGAVSSMNDTLADAGVFTTKTELQENGRKISLPFSPIMLFVGDLAGNITSADSGTANQVLPPYVLLNGMTATHKPYDSNGWNCTTGVTAYLSGATLYVGNSCADSNNNYFVRGGLNISGATYQWVAIA